MKGWKSHPSSTSARACLQNSYCAHSRWTKCGSVFLSGNFLICWETIATLRDPPAMLGEHLRQKQSPRPSLKPKNFAKNLTGVATKWPRILSNFVKWPIQPLSKIFWTQKKIAKIFFFLKKQGTSPQHKYCYLDLVIWQVFQEGSTLLCYFSLFLGCWNIDHSLLGQLRD